MDDERIRPLHYPFLSAVSGISECFTVAAHRSKAISQTASCRSLAVSPAHEVAQVMFEGTSLACSSVAGCERQAEACTQKHARQLKQWREGWKRLKPLPGWSASAIRHPRPSICWSNLLAATPAAFSSLLWRSLALLSRATLWLLHWPYLFVNSLSFLRVATPRRRVF